MAEDVLAGVEHDVRAEQVMAAASRSDAPTALADGELPFDAAAVRTYENRLSALRDAVIGMETYEGAVPRP